MKSGLLFHLCVLWVASFFCKENLGQNVAAHCFFGEVRLRSSVKDQGRETRGVQPQVLHWVEGQTRDLEFCKTPFGVWPLENVLSLVLDIILQLIWFRKTLFSVVTLCVWAESQNPPVCVSWVAMWQFADTRLETSRDVQAGPGTWDTVVKSFLILGSVSLFKLKGLRITQMVSIHSVFLWVTFNVYLLFYTCVVLF